MLILLLATCIGVLKVASDSGRSKLYFILAMAISVYTISNHWLPSLLFMLPLIVYVMETGDLHKLNKRNTPRINWSDAGYAMFLSICFTLPFLYTNMIYSLPLLLWPIALRNITYGLPQPDGTKGSEWWWICTFALFFSYSALYFHSWIEGKNY